MTSVRGGGTIGAQPVSHSSSLTGDGSGADSDYYAIGLPIWKKELLLRRKQQQQVAVRSESRSTESNAVSRPTLLESASEARVAVPTSRPLSPAAIVVGVDVMPSAHVALSRRPSGGGGSGGSADASVGEASPSTAAVTATADGELPYETGFVSKIRMRFSRLATTSEEGGVGPATATVAVAGRRFVHVEPPAYLATTTRIVGDPRSPTAMAPSAAYLQRRRSSGARDASEIVIVERSTTTEATSLQKPQQQPMLLLRPQQRHNLQPQHRVEAPRSSTTPAARSHLSSPGDEGDRTSTAVVITPVAATASKAEPPVVRSAASAAPDAAAIAVRDRYSDLPRDAGVSNATAVNGRPAAPAVSDVSPSSAAAQKSSGLSSSVAASAASAAVVTTNSRPTTAGRAAAVAQRASTHDVELPPEKIVGPSKASDAHYVQPTRVPTAAVPAAAASSQSDDRSDEFFRPALRELVPERGTGKRLLDTRTDSGFQRRIPDYERREGKVPLFLNANVVVGRGSFRKSAPPKAKIRQNVSFSDLTDTKVYPSEGELMTEMSRETGSAYYDDPTVLGAVTTSSEGGPSFTDDDDSELRALTSTALSSRVAAAARSETLGSYRASLVGTYSFGQHLLKDHHNGDGCVQQQPADGVGIYYSPTDIILKPADGIGLDKEQSSAAFSANETSDLLF